MANIDLETLTLLYEGKAKQVYQTDKKDEYIVHTKMMLLHLTVKSMIPSLAKAY